MLNCYISNELLMSNNYSSRKNITISLYFNNVLELLIRSLDFMSLPQRQHKMGIILKKAQTEY